MGNSAVPYSIPKLNLVRRKAPERIQSILSLALRKSGLDRDIARYNFVLHWKEIVGEDVAERTRPECFRNGALVVRVADSAWAQELSFQKESILKRLKKFMGDPCDVSDVQFYVAAL